MTDHIAVAHSHKLITQFIGDISHQILRVPDGIDGYIVRLECQDAGVINQLRKNRCWPEDIIFGPPGFPVCLQTMDKDNARRHHLG